MTDSSSIPVNVNELSQSLINTLPSSIRSDYSEYQSSGTHAAFFLMKIPISKFESAHHYHYQSGNSSSGSRGGITFNPPRSCWKYALKVSGIFDGDDNWFGSSNKYGEWAVGYHGTSPNNLYSLLNSPMYAGSGDSFGKGIYVSPDFSTAEGYSSSYSVQTKKGTKTFKFVLMCRVNTKNVHHCTTSPCPYAQSTSYTLHMTTNSSIWFVNQSNTNHQNIRITGILVKHA
jgi:hypothetical protein